MVEDARTGADGPSPVRTRARAPWLVWGAGMAALAATLTLSGVNGLEESDPLVLSLATTMVLGYATVGALLASRNPRNPLGWLLMSVGLAFVTTGFTDQYSTYTLVRDPGSLPGGVWTAVLSKTLELPMGAAMSLVALLFPTGRVPGPRWRFLPALIVGLAALAVTGRLLAPGPVDLGAGVVENPAGVPGLGAVAEPVAGLAGFGLLLASIPSVVAPVLRYRRSRGEERQQLRWLAYVAATVASVVLLGIATALLAGDWFDDSLLAEVFFYATFVLVGIGVPAALGVAVLKYRLYDLDLVVRKTVLYGVVAVLLTALFLVVALSIGGIAGRSEAGAIVAAALIGLMFWPAVRVARRVADRVVYGARATPYDVLAEFSSRLGESYGAEDVLPRMARVLGEALGSSRATVWLRVGHELRPAATWPPGPVSDPIPIAGDELPALPADSGAEVRDRGELLGSLSVSMPANDPINPAKERLVRDLASQAGLVLRNVRLIEELRDSRRRIVAAQDERARKLERDIHDGAQQQLVALTVKLRLAQQLIGRDPQKSEELLGQVQTEAVDALDTLRDLARGIYPPLLADKGLGVALDAQARKSPLPVEVEADGLSRYSQDVEAAVYFCVLEALQNAAKYSRAKRARVRLRAAHGELEFLVEDDGIGFDPATADGSGIRNMRDRLEALGGSVDIASAPRAGTRLTGRVPATPLDAARPT